MSPNLSIVIPVYNEQGRIGATLCDMIEYFMQIGIKYEIIVVADGCSDYTEILVNAIKNWYKADELILDSKTIREGKGNALVRGIMLAKGEYVIYTDADGSVHPSELYALFFNLHMMKEYDAVIGSRWMPGSRVKVKQSLKRRIASRWFNRLARLFLGLPYTDTQCPAKVFKREAIQNVCKGLQPGGFAIDAIILYLMKERGYKVLEHPIEWNDVLMSTVKIRKAAPSMLKAILKLKIGWLQKEENL